MFCVYHMSEHFDELHANADFFKELKEALDWSNELRKRGCRFVTLVSEIEGNTTKMGVAGLEADEYEWKKRR